MCFEYNHIYVTPAVYIMTHVHALQQIFQKHPKTFRTIDGDYTKIKVSKLRDTTD